MLLDVALSDRSTFCSLYVHTIAHAAVSRELNRSATIWFNMLVCPGRRSSSSTKIVASQSLYCPSEIFSSPQMYF